MYGLEGSIGTSRGGHSYQPRQVRVLAGLGLHQRSVVVLGNGRQFGLSAKETGESRHGPSAGYGKGGRGDPYRTDAGTQYGDF